MTDIISNIKIQKPVPINNRRVSLNQNPHHENHHQFKTNSVLSNSNDLPVDSYVLANSSPLSYKPTNQKHLLLKSSLKLHGNIPTIAKSVRFNMPLTQTLHFHVPPTAEEETYEQDHYDDNEDDGDYFSDDQDDQEEEEENELEDAFLELFSKRLSPSSGYDPSLYYPTIQQSILDSSFDLTLKLPNWPAKRPENQMVALESLAWKNSSSIIEGRVLVRNIAFEKAVTVRMSFNHWQTWIDVDARYDESSEDTAFDRFVFELVTANHLSYMNVINSGSHCSLAVKYQANGFEYWDNNSGNNFVMQWSSPCGYDDMIGAKKEELLSSTMFRSQQVTSFLMEQQVNCPTPVMAYYQEKGMQLQKEEYYATITSDGYPACNNLYIEPPLIDRYEKKDMFDGSFGFSTQHQVSTHFQFHLDRKKQEREGREYDCPRRRSVKDHNAEFMPVSLTPSSPLLIPPITAELIIT